jgi:hypothetical protein
VLILKSTKCQNSYLCEYCKGEIYDNDIICNLNEVYGEGDYIVHEECIADSLLENKEKTHDFIFDDLCKLSEIFDTLLSKYVAWEYLDSAEEPYDDCY